MWPAKHTQLIVIMLIRYFDRYNILYQLNKSDGQEGNTVLEMADYLQINHVSGKRYFWVLSSVHCRDVGFFDLLLNKPCSSRKLGDYLVTTTREQKVSQTQQHSLSFLSISSHLLTSFTNLRWNTFTSGFSCC